MCIASWTFGVNEMHGVVGEANTWFYHEFGVVDQTREYLKLKFLRKLKARHSETLEDDFVDHRNDGINGKTVRRSASSSVESLTKTKSICFDSVWCSVMLLVVRSEIGRREADAGVVWASGAEEHSDQAERRTVPPVSACMLCDVFCAWNVDRLCTMSENPPPTMQALCEHSGILVRMAAEKALRCITQWVYTPLKKIPYEWVSLVLSCSPFIWKELWQAHPSTLHLKWPLEACASNPQPTMSVFPGT